MNETERQALENVGNAQVQQEQEDVGRALLSSWQSNAPDPHADAKRSYVTSLVDGVLDRRDEKAAQSADSFATAVETHRSIHAAAFAEKPDGDGEEAAPGPAQDFDPAALSHELGLDVAGLNTLQFESFDDFHNAVGPEIENLVNSISNTDALAAVEGAMADPEIGFRCTREISSWRSPRYGRATDGRNQTQSARTTLLVANAFKLAAALHREGKSLQIEQVLRLARLADDMDYAPSKRGGHAAPKISTASRIGNNIHEVHKNNPF